jgi:uncharacterized protein (TIGR02145 family)
VLAYKANPSDAIAYTIYYTNSTSPYDWFSDGGTQNTAALRKGWGDGTTGANPAKGQNDPCPTGWKVPSRAHWGSIFMGGTSSGTPNSATANSWDWTGNHGFKVGSALYLPAAGCRYYDAGTLYVVGSTGLYWSSTWLDATNSFYVSFYDSYVSPDNLNRRAFGYSVRCVAE